MVSQVVGFLQSASHWRGQPTCEMGHKPTGFATIEAMKHVSPYRNSRLAIILFATALIILWGNAAMAMTLKSPAFQQNGHIPSKYTCEGEGVSPALAWEGAPNGAKSLVLIIDDPDAPDPKAPKMVWVHWVVYNMPHDTKSLPENAGKARFPQGALLGINDFKDTGYGGHPCAMIRCAILAGRSAEVKKQLLSELWTMLQDATGLEDDKLLVSIQDNPANNAMEAGEILPEPQHEAEWFAGLGRTGH